MRLIDADALKEEFDLYTDRKGYLKADPIDLIDNAPTVEPCYQTTSCLDCKNYDKANYYCPRFCEVIREIAKENQRPQGEWKLHGMIYYCSECGHDCEQGGNNFCGNCGADMRGKEE